jgi:WD40 repeat protein
MITILACVFQFAQLAIQLILSGFLCGVEPVVDGVSSLPEVPIHFETAGVWDEPLSLSPNGKFIIGDGHDAQERTFGILWDATTGKVFRRWQVNERSQILVMSPDGALVSGKDWSTDLPLWEAATGKDLTWKNVHSKPVCAVAFAPDAKSIATAGMDNTVKFWDLKTAACTASFSGSVGEYGHIAISPNGQMLAAVNKDGGFWIWNVATGKEAWHFHGPKEQIYRLAFSPDGAVLATGGENSIRLWDVKSGREKAVLKHPQRVWCLAFSPDSKMLASSCWESTEEESLKIWDLASNKEIFSFKPDAPGIDDVAFTPDGKRLYVRCPRIRVYDVAKLLRWQRPQNRVTVRKQGARIISFAFCPDGKRFATASENEPVKVWDASSGAELLSLGKPKADGWDVSYSPNGRTLLATSNAGEPIHAEVKLWDAVSGKERASFQQDVSFPKPVFSPTSRLLAISKEGRIALWDLETGNYHKMLPGFPDWNRSLAFSPEGRTLATACEIPADPFQAGRKWHLKLWDVATGKPSSMWTKEPDGGDISLAFNPDGKILTSYIRIGRALGDMGPCYYLTIRDLATGIELFSTTDAFSQPLFTPDSRSFISITNNSDIGLWDTIRGAKRILVRDDDYASNLLLSPNGRILITSRTSEKNNSFTRVWDFGTGRKMAVLEDARPLGFSPDSKTLVTTGQKGDIRLWHLPTLGGFRQANWLSYGANPGKMP